MLKDSVIDKTLLTIQDDYLAKGKKFYIMAITYSDDWEETSYRSYWAVNSHDLIVAKYYFGRHIDSQVEEKENIE